MKNQIDDFSEILNNSVRQEIQFLEKLKNEDKEYFDLLEKIAVDDFRQAVENEKLIKKMNATIS